MSFGRCSRAVVVAALAALFLAGAATPAFAAKRVAGQPVVTRLSVHGSGLFGDSSSAALVITGQHLDRVNTVLFGTVVTHRVTRISSTKLETVVPAHPSSTVPIRVRTKNGPLSRVHWATRFTYEAAPAITKIDRTDASTAGGSTVTLVGQNFQNATRVMFGHVPAAALTRTGKSHLTATTPVHIAGTVALSVRYAYGVSAPVTFRFGKPNSVAWTTPTEIDSGHPRMALSCVSSAFCAAADASNKWLNFVNGSWTLPTRSAGGNSVSCVSTTFCMSVTGPYTFTWDGQTWTRLDNPFPDGNAGTTAADLVGVSCASTAFCLVNGGGEVATWNGASWTSLARPDTTADHAGTSVDAIDCWAAGACAAVGDGVLLEFANGVWSELPSAFVSKAVPTSDGTTCFDAADCQIGLSDGSVVTLADDKLALTPHVLPAGNTLVRCSAVDECLASGVMNTATWDGSGWSASARSPIAADGGPLVVTGLSCPAQRSCVAVGSSDAATITW